MITFGLPFYRNPEMLAHQYRVWRDYPDAIKAHIELVLVDDASPEQAADVPRPDGLPALRIYRFGPAAQTPPWRQHAARNLAAHVARGSWLLLTDMDHVLPASCATLLLERIERDAFYTFHRLDAPAMQPKRLRGNFHPHQNTFAVTKARYWRAGGYDEEFCGIYGTDGFFLRTLMTLGTCVHLDDVHVVRYPREVIADASTRAPEGMDPKAFRDSARRLGHVQRRLSDKAMQKQGPQILSVPWVQVL